tara:strand:- start:86 stop:385 length:300 start_codon:yes stop_codon:yes gene_type:complete
MNKLYAFCALVFLTACGSPGIDGSWTPADGYDGEIEITGDKAKIIDRDETLMCNVEGPDLDVYTLTCLEDPIEYLVYLRLDGDILKVTMSNMEFDYVRK